MAELFDIPKLLKLRKTTNSISSYLEQELKFYINTLSPLFHPELVFGEYINGCKQSIKGSDVSFKKLKEAYQSLRQNKLFYDRLDDFKSPMDIFATALEFIPYEYDYQANANGESKKIRIISPMKWVLSYKDQGLKQLNELLNDRAGSKNDDIMVCVLHHLVLQSLCAKRDDISRLFSAVRFNIISEASKAFANLPLIIISSPISTIRPADELIIQSTELSGSSIFEEVINLDDIEHLTDPFKDHLLQLVKNNS